MNPSAVVPLLPPLSGGIGCNGGILSGGLAAHYPKMPLAAIAGWTSKFNKNPRLMELILAGKRSPLPARKQNKMLIPISKACELLDTCSAAIIAGVTMSREEMQEYMGDLINKPYGKGEDTMVEIENGVITLRHLESSLKMIPLFPYSPPENN